MNYSSVISVTTVPQQFLYWNLFFCPLITLQSVFLTSMKSLLSLRSVLWAGSLEDSNPTVVSINQTKRIPVLSSEPKIMQENKCRNCKPHSHTSEITGNWYSVPTVGGLRDIALVYCQLLSRKSPQEHQRVCEPKRSPGTHSWYHLLRFYTVVFSSWEIQSKLVNLVVKQWECSALFALREQYYNENGNI